jgi:hypothetical protein
MTFNPVEIEKILETMVILRDTREQDTARARRRYAAFGLPCRRAVLDYGDYTYDCVLPSGSGLYPDDQKRLFPMCAVERKMNLDELAQCFTHDRKRFEAEMVRCLGHGGRMYLLVENASWELLLKGGYRSRFRSNAFLASITAWMVRYDLQIVFCTEETSPVLIREILYRDLKERLTNGNIG